MIIYGWNSPKWIIAMKSLVNQTTNPKPRTHSRDLKDLNQVSGVEKIEDGRNK